jgi:hypothetical protein
VISSTRELGLKRSAHQLRIGTDVANFGLIAHTAGTCCDCDREEAENRCLPDQDHVLLRQGKGPPGAVLGADPPRRVFLLARYCGGVSTENGRIDRGWTSGVFS